MLRFIFDTCRERQVHAIFNTGDTWDGPVILGDQGPVNEIFELLHMCPAPMYIVEGTKTHDIPGSIDTLGHLSFGRIDPSYITITCYDWPQSFKTQFGHLSILPAPTKSFLARDPSGTQEEINVAIQDKLRDILKGFAASAADSPKPHILLSHITVTGSETSTGQTMLGGDIQVSVADLELANADIVLLGHIHKCQSLGRNIYYAGSPYHQNFGELEDKGFLIITFEDGDLVDVEFIKTPSRPRQVLDVQIIAGALDWGDSVVCPGADVRVRLYGTIAEIEAADREPEIKKFCESANSLKIEKMPQPENRVRSANIAAAKTIREKLVEYAAVKEIEIPETAIQKAERLDEVTV